MKRSGIIGIVAVVVVLIAGLSVGLYFLLRSGDGQGAVATLTVECTDASIAILQKGGSAVDAAITACLCTGLTSSHSSGLGGGMVAMVYIKKTGIIDTLNSREKAPIAAYKDMYFNESLSAEGGLAIAVPGELKGLFELHKRYGKLKWAEVVQPVIDIAENGFVVNEKLAVFYVSYATRLNSKPFFSEVFTNPETGEFYKEGELFKHPKLAKTLKAIAKEGSDAIYGGGSLAQGLVDEIQQQGGIVTMDDLKNFQPRWGKAMESKLFNGDTMYSFPLPTCGSVLTFIMNILNGYNIQDHSLEYHKENKLMYHRMMEAYKYGFAGRTKLGDELQNEDVLKALEQHESVDYANGIRSLIWDNKTFNDSEHYGAVAQQQADHGTAHMSILAPNGDAVSLTATINDVFGSFVMSESTGIIFNDEMNDFSIPASNSLPAPANFIVPGKSPISSMSPIITVNSEKDATLIVGGSGGRLIMTSVIQVIVNFFYLNQSLETSLAMKRIHHQLQPMSVRYEFDFDEGVLEFLKERDHEIYQQPQGSGFAGIIAIGRKDGNVEASVDPRRGGKYTIF